MTKQEYEKVLNGYKSILEKQTRVGDSVGIIRVSKDKDNPYVVLNKTCLEDVKLSWQSKRLTFISD
ncbi:hypothetical protein ACD471_20185|uniref:hypothetical protein n=1 Tax=Clostridioides difficile TaxID=1496 RepID=UPI00355BB8CF